METMIELGNKPQKMGKILLQNKNQKSAQQFYKCEICKTRMADSLLGKLCGVCFRQIQYRSMPKEQQQHLLLSIVPERYTNAEISDLSPTLQAGMAKENDTGILLWGASGTGKTYAMAALAKKYIPEGYLVKRVHYEMLCLQLRDTFNRNATEREWKIIEPLLNCDKLFIEDVGTGKSIGKQETDYSLRTFLVLMDIRMERCRPTFITSNKSVENLGRSFDERISDRLRTFLVYKMAGDSKRKTK